MWLPQSCQLLSACFSSPEKRLTYCTSLLPSGLEMWWLQHAGNQSHDKGLLNKYLT